MRTIHLFEKTLGVLYRRNCVGCDTVCDKLVCQLCEASWSGLLAHKHKGITFAASHAGPVRNMIHAFKYKGRCTLAGYFAEKLVPLLPPGPWVVVPIPAHFIRRLQRGYDQAELLGRAISRQSGWPYQRVLRRTRWTKSSPGLHRFARQANLEGAFTACREMTGLSVLLVDDVFTTGATVQAATSALYAAGAELVHPVVIAKKL